MRGVGLVREEEEYLRVSCFEYHLTLGPQFFRVILVLQYEIFNLYTVQYVLERSCSCQMSD